MNQYVTGAIIKELREKYHFTQVELAEKLNVSDKTVSKWETAKGYPDISLLESIAKVFGISVTELISGNAISNVNISANMMRSKFYVCPVCGNSIHSMEEAVIQCHGLILTPCQAEETGTENLLYALIDEPEEVQRLIRETEIAWYEAYHDFANVLKPQGAYTDWNGILSREPSYIIQCDFSYMISPDMFQEYVLETLRKDTKYLTNVMYHLDGTGQLAHLDMILGIKDLKAVQWVCGAGKPGPLHWMDVYKKIVDAGKQIMVIDNAIDNGFMEIARTLNCNPYTHLSVEACDREIAMKILKDAFDSQYN